MTPSTNVERIEASVNEMAGGESTIICVNFSPRAVSKRRISSEPSSSAGFGGMGPDGKSFKLGCFS
jgi:hypothetical protein